MRLFIALALPDPVRNAMAALSEPMRGLSWTRREQWHLTLRFLGDVTEEQFDRMREKLATVRVEPFILPVEGVGTFPPKRPPKIVWVGVGAGHPRLHQLRQRIDDAILGTGFPLDVRTFHPHVTLARCTPDAGPALSRWIRMHGGFVAPPFRVESFDIYSSELRPAGAVHTLVQRFPLQPGH